MAERSGVIPMFDTIMFMSSGETTLRISSSILATYSSVTSMRVPGGTFTLTTNCPGSVRGKNAFPTNG